MCLTLGKYQHVDLMGSVISRREKKVTWKYDCVGDVDIKLREWCDNGQLGRISVKYVTGQPRAKYDVKMKNFGGFGTYQRH